MSRRVALCDDFTDKVESLPTESKAAKFRRFSANVENMNQLFHRYYRVENQAGENEVGC